LAASARIELSPPARSWQCSVPVHTVIKADLRCASVAAASVLAKTERDALLVALAEQFPVYGFEANKAYSSPAHYAALLEHGPCQVHRRSWNLPGTPSYVPPRTDEHCGRSGVGHNVQMQLTGSDH
jgi:ribonuclease HII